MTALCAAAVCAGMLCLVPAADDDPTPAAVPRHTTIIALVFRPRAEVVELATLKTRALRNLKWDTDVREAFDTVARAAALPVEWSALTKTAPPHSAQALLRLVIRNSGSQILAQLAARQDGRVSVEQVLQQVCGVGLRRDADRLVDGVMRAGGTIDSAAQPATGEFLLPVSDVPRILALAALVHGLPTPALRALQQAYTKKREQ